VGSSLPEILNRPSKQQLAGLRECAGMSLERRVGCRRDRRMDPGFRSLIDAPSPAVLLTYRKDGSANVSPVWFRWKGDAFEVVIARGDVKLKHLGSEPRCALLVFEAVPPFRGIEVRGVPELVEGDVTEAREDIAGRYLGIDDGRQFAAARVSKPRSCSDSRRTSRAFGISRRSCPLLDRRRRCGQRS
jgi:Pyridoxamine 5'-phosphate oxidase